MRLSCLKLLLLFTALTGTVEIQAQAPLPPLDSARMELDRGRAWHAVRILRSLDADRAFTPTQALLLARAEAGWRNWPGVIEALGGVDRLSEIEDGLGAYLLGRAFAEEGRWQEADRWLSAYEAGQGSSRGGALARSRLARVRAAAGLLDAAVATLEAMEEDPEELRHWTALEVARAASLESDARVVRLALRSAAGEAHRRGWALEGDALLRRGDSTAALGFFRARAPSLSSSARRAWALMMAGQLLLAEGDTSGARASYQASLEAFPQGMSGSFSARGLLAAGNVSSELAFRLAEVLGRNGDAEASLEAYDVHLGALEGAPGPELLFARAGQLAAAGRREEAVTVLRQLSETPDSTLQLRVLERWMDVRRDQRRGDAVRTIQGWILERFPSSRQAAEIHFYRADALHDRGAYEEAISAYRSATETGSSSSLADLAWMRLGLIEMERGRYESAAAVFLEYTERFPEGALWDQATYWLGRAATEVEGADAGREHFGAVMRRLRTSYYSVLSAAELGESFAVDVPAAPEAGATPIWIREGLEVLDLLTDADLEDAASWWVGRLRSRAGEAIEDRPSLAEALIERGFTVEGIRLGQAHLSEGKPLDQRLVRIIYPFPFREVIVAEANERGLDPFFLAGLIRQESAFDPDIVSRAGAIGLMQVMPATGLELAEGERIRGFSSESLETPEINLHLGVNYWLELERRFEGEHVPLRLSAYNAGPTRARRWRNLPENADALRFTERIPFQETRGYVKSVSRNAALYRALYGAEAAPAVEGASGESR